MTDNHAVPSSNLGAATDRKGFLDMTWLNGLEMVNALIVCIGVILISIPNIKGIWLMLLAQTGWTLFAFINQQWFFLFQSIFLFFANVYGIYSWHKQSVGVKK